MSSADWIGCRHVGDSRRIVACSGIRAQSGPYLTIAVSSEVIRTLSEAIDCCPMDSKIEGDRVVELGREIVCDLRDDISCRHGYAGAVCQIKGDCHQLYSRAGHQDAYATAPLDVLLEPRPMTKQSKTHYA